MSLFFDRKEEHGVRIKLSTGSLCVQDWNHGHWYDRKGATLRSDPQAGDADAIELIMEVARVMKPGTMEIVERFLRERAEHQQLALAQAVERAESHVNGIAGRRAGLALARELSDRYNVVDAEIIDESDGGLAL